MLVRRKLLFVAITWCCERGSDGKQIDAAVKGPALMMNCTRHVRRTRCLLTRLIGARVADAGSLAREPESRACSVLPVVL